ncbi:hypothetical protein ACN47E_000141 [Coniothyrium glycines]
MITNEDEREQARRLLIYMRATLGIMPRFTVTRVLEQMRDGLMEHHIICEYQSQLEDWQKLQTERARDLFQELQKKPGDHPNIREVTVLEWVRDGKTDEWIKDEYHRQIHEHRRPRAIDLLRGMKILFGDSVNVTEDTLLRWFDTGISNQECVYKYEEEWTDDQCLWLHLTYDLRYAASFRNPRPYVEDQLTWIFDQFLMQFHSTNQSDLLPNTPDWVEAKQRFITKLNKLITTKLPILRAGSRKAWRENEKVVHIGIIEVNKDLLEHYRRLRGSVPAIEEIQHPERNVELWAWLKSIVETQYPLLRTGFKRTETDSKLVSHNGATDGENSILAQAALASMANTTEHDHDEVDTTGEQSHAHHLANAVDEVHAPSPECPIAQIQVPPQSLQHTLSLTTPALDSNPPTRTSKSGYIQCAAVSKNGQRCNRFAPTGFKTCHNHKSIPDTT